MNTHPNIERVIRANELIVETLLLNEKKRKTRYEHFWAIVLVICILATSHTLLFHLYWNLVFNVSNALIIAVALYRYKRTESRSSKYINDFQSIINWLRSQEAVSQDEVNSLLQEFERKIEELGRELD